MTDEDYIGNLNFTKEDIIQRLEDMCLNQELSDEQVEEVFRIADSRIRLNITIWDCYWDQIDEAIQEVKEMIYRDTGTII